MLSEKIAMALLEHNVGRRMAKVATELRPMKQPKVPAPEMQAEQISPGLNAKPIKAKRPSYIGPPKTDLKTKVEVDPQEDVTMSDVAEVPLPTPIYNPSEEQRVRDAYHNDVIMPSLPPLPIPGMRNR